SSWLRPPVTVLLAFLFSRSGAPRALHSFPTRRSSDLSRPPAAQSPARAPPAPPSAVRQRLRPQPAQSFLPDRQSFPFQLAAGSKSAKPAPQREGHAPIKSSRAGRLALFDFDFAL